MKKVYLICFLVSLFNTINAQVLVYPIAPQQIGLNEVSAQRDYVSSFRMVLMAGQTQTLCIDRPDLGRFDTLINTDCIPLNHSIVTIEENCIHVAVNSNAPVSKEKICLQYWYDEENFEELTVDIEVVTSKPLPFFDDFSAEDVRPNQNRWIDRNVFVNQTMAFQPPSLGVATFDGLNSNGTPYGGSFGTADYLTSTLINTSDIGSDSTFLIFFIQPKGNMYFHELRDSFAVEFKTRDGIWVRQVTYPGISPSMPSNFVPPFEKKSVYLGTDFQYDGFQFRFVNYSYRKGIYSTWHLDYVLIRKGFRPNQAIDDVAFTDLPANFLKQYSKIPFRQFTGRSLDAINNKTFIGINNQYEITQNSGVGRILISELNSGTNIYSSNGLFIADQSQLNLKPGQSYFENDLNVSDFAQQVESVPFGTSPLRFSIEYLIKPNQGPIAADTSNNRTKRINEVGYTLAYDDGTPELNIAASATNSIKSQIAVKYRLEVGDTLKAISLHIPRLFNDVGDQLFNLKVWIGQLDDEPEYQYLLQKAIYPDKYFDTLNGFTTYPLVDDLSKDDKFLYIPPGDFYIGWQQFTTSDQQQFIPVGLDKSMPNGDQLTYFKSTGNWNTLSELNPGKFKGIPMIRGIFKSEWLTSSISDISVDKIHLYPNPANHLLNLDGKLDASFRQLAVMNIDGDVVLSSPISKSIDISTLINGVYFLFATELSGAKKYIGRFVKI